MSSQGPFRIVYPIESFDGGLNNKYDRNIIDDSQSPDCLNVEYSDRGGVKTRSGCSLLNTTAVGSYSGDGLFTTRYNDGTETMVGFWNGTAYKLAGTTFTAVASGTSIFTAGERVDHAMYQNLAFFGNGYSTPYKYNNTEWTRQGITSPNSTAAHTSGVATATAVPTGDVQYKITYVNSYSVESDVSSATATLAVAVTASVSITCLPIAPTSFGVAHRRLYRMDASTAGTYKRVATIADNTTTTYLDGIGSLSLGAAAPTDQGLPPNWQYTVAHQERLWAVGPTNPQYLYYSELGNPFVFKATNYILIGDGDGESITSLGVHANMIVVGKSASVWLIFMPDTDPTNWVRIKSNSKYGFASHYAQADYNGLKLFIGKRYGQLQGFLTLKGADTQPDATQLLSTAVLSETQSDRIEPDVFNFTSSAIAKACAIEYRNKLWFAVPYDSATTNTRVYQFDYVRRVDSKHEGSWAPFEYPYSFSAFTIYGGFLYAQGGLATGYVYKLNANGYSDNGTAINSYAWTKEFYGHQQHMENYKDLRFAYFTVETLGTYNMNISYRAEDDPGAGTAVTVSLNPDGAVWNQFNWGDGTLWGGGNVQRRVTIPLGTLKGKRVQFKFSNQNTLGQGFHVFPHGSFSYNLKGVR